MSLCSFAQQRRAVARLVAGAALLLATPVVAATLSGRLLESETHRPVEGAAVRLLETGQWTRSDARGAFAFGALPAGRYTLSVHHLAYADVERVVAVGGSGGDSLALSLRPALFHADEVLVRSARSLASMRRTPYSADVRTREHLDELPVVTPPEALAAMPGVALIRDGAWETAVSIRGLGRSNIVALVDGTRIETATDISGGLSLIDPEDLERIEVMKSAGSVLFGSGALGGAVQMVSRRADFSARPRWSTEWSNRVTSVDGGFAQHLAVERSSERVALRLSGGRRQGGDTDTPQGPLANSRYEDWSLNGSLGVRTIGEQSLRLTYQRMQAEDTGIPGGAAIGTTAIARYPMSRRELVGAEYTVPNLSARIPLVTLRLSHQDIVRDVEILQSPTITLTPHATHATVSAQLEARLLPARDHLLVVGAEAWQRDLDSQRERWLKAQNRVIGEHPLPRSQYLSAGLFAQDEWELVPQRTRLVAGARYDLGRTHNATTLNPDYVIASGVRLDPTPGQVVLWDARTSYDASWDANAGLHQELGPHLAASLLVATAYRSPALEERFQFLDLGSSVHLGDPALRPERSVCGSAGVQASVADTRVRVDAFYNRLTDLVTEIPATYQGRPAFVKANIGQARLFGYEASGDQRLGGRLALQASAAYVRGDDTRSDTSLPQVPPFSGHVQLRADAGPAGTVTVACVAARTQARLGAGETRTPGYAVWDVALTSAPWTTAGVACRLHAGVENVFDRAYREHLETLRGLVKLEPGRNAFLAVTVDL